MQSSKYVCMFITGGPVYGTKPTFPSALPPSVPHSLSRSLALSLSLTYGFSLSLSQCLFFFFLLHMIVLFPARGDIQTFFFLFFPPPSQEAIQVCDANLTRSEIDVLFLSVDEDHNGMYACVTSHLCAMCYDDDT